MAKRKYDLTIVINTSKGEEYVELPTLTRREVARDVRRAIAWQREATSFVFTVARVGKPASEGGSNE